MKEFIGDFYYYTNQHDYIYRSKAKPIRLYGRIKDNNTYCFHIWITFKNNE